MPFCEVFQHSVAVTVGEDKLARAAPVGAATDLLDVEAAVQEVAQNFDGLGDASGLHSIVLVDNGAGGIAATDLQAAPNSEGMGNAAELHGKLNSKVAFSLPDFEGHGGDVNILGDLGSIAFSVTREAVIRGSHSNSLHCHLIHVHAPSLASFSDCVCGECCGSVCARVGAGGGDDVGMDACVDEKVGSNSLIQGSGCHAKACACLDALQNSRRVRGHCLRGGTKCSSTGSGAQVWLSDGIKVSLSHQKSGSLHVETWAGAQGSLPQRVSQVQEYGARCALVSSPSFYSDLTPVLPGPGSEIRRKLGWTQMEKTDRSGVWFFRGALQGEDLFSSLAVSGDWVRKGSYHTAWSVPGDSSCSCSYAYGHGTAIGSHTGKRCWALLSWLWWAIAPLMKPWCAEGKCRRLRI